MMSLSPLNSHSNLHSPLSTPTNMTNGISHEFESKYDVSPGEECKSQSSLDEYKKLYNVLRDFMAYGVPISVPEFTFIGFQSSGKTSAVSQLVGFAVGVMQDGTASRCPTRFKLVNNPKYKNRVIQVNGAVCKDQADLTKKVLQIHKKYEEEKIFSNEIIEVRIESCDAAELTFVDLPGLMKGDNEEYAESKKQLDQLSAQFLHETNEDGSYRYWPILVREPEDPENDQHLAAKRMDQLTHAHGHGDNKRCSWRDDTLFIVNKFDTAINRNPASSLIEYMKYVSNYGETVVTMMNPSGQSTGTMSHTQLNEYVKKVPHLEEQKWQHVMGQFTTLNDENLEELKALKDELCGVARLHTIITDKMCTIVKKILPFIERQLQSTEQAKQKEISNIIKQMQMCDPQKLKTECIEFGNRFMQYFRQFYNGRLPAQIDPKYDKTWANEESDFEAICRSTPGPNRAQWKYKITPHKLQSLLKKSGNKPKPMHLLLMLEMETMASAAIDRIIDAWKCQVAHMSFPTYSDRDIVKMSGGFNYSKQFPVWLSVRNVVLDAVKHLVAASNYLAEMLRYKLKENADIIFEYTLLEKFSTLDGQGNIIKLLQRTLADYKAEIDNIMNEFVVIVSASPTNQAEIIDQDFCEETVNIGTYIGVMLQNKKQQSSFDLKKGKKKSKHRRATTEYYPPPPQGPPPANIKAMSIVPQDSVSSNSRSEQETKMAEPIDSWVKTKRSKKESKRDYHYDLEKYDVSFYEGMFCQYPKHRNPITFGDASYNIDLIRQLSRVFWTNIKQVIIKDTTQKVLNCVMSHVTQHDDRLTNAVQRGVDRTEIENLLNLLVDKTGVDVGALEELIKEKSTIPIPKSIHDLDNKELLQMYGIDRERLEKILAEKINELNEFQLKKKETLEMIYRIKNNEFETNKDGQREAGC
eukprot:210015_1